MKRLLARSTAVAGMMVLLVGAAAWACTPQETISLSPSSGPAGATVTVTGNGFDEGEQVPVEWSWPSGSTDVVATGVGPNFSVSFTVPDASPDVYYVSAMYARASFTVTKPRPQPTGDDAGSGSGDSTATVNGSSGSSGGSTSGSASGSSGGGGTTSGQASGASGGQRSGDTGSGGIPSPTDARPSPGRAPAGPAVASAGPGAATAASGVAGRSSSAESSQPAAGSADASSDAPAVAQDSLVPSAQTAFGDLWSGFAAGPEVRRGASLTDSYEGRSGTPADAVGLVLLGIGMATFVFGSLSLVAAERRRRGARVPAS